MSRLPRSGCSLPAPSRRRARASGGGSTWSWCSSSDSNLGYARVTLKTFADNIPAGLRPFVPNTRDEARRLGAFLVALTVLDILVNLRFPSGEQKLWYLLPSVDVLFLIGAFAIVRALGLRIPTAGHVLLAGLVCLVRVLRFGDGVLDRYFAQRFSLYDLPFLPEGVRFAYSALPWWKFALLAGGLFGVLAMVPLFAYRALRTADDYLADWRRAPLLGVIAVIAFACGLAVPRKTHHQKHFAGGFGASVVPRLEREAKFLWSVYADRGKWARAIVDASALLARTPSNLAKLEQKNVHLILVESYGTVAVGRPDFVAALTPTFHAVEAELGALGYSIATGTLASPTFGGRSWLAQATLATAIPVTDQLGFDTVATSKPRVMSDFFRAAGYRTVFAAPAVTRPGTRGDPYRFDKNYYYKDFEYAGPAFAWATMPDQFLFDTIRRRELGRSPGTPLFVQYVLVSSHSPWSAIPTIVEDWSMLRNGAIYETQPVLRFPVVWPNLTHSHEAYIRSIVYDFEVIRRYVARFLNDDSLVIVLGDHQPASEIIGDDRAKSVPVHVFSKNAAFVDAFRRRGYVSGMWPTGAAPPRGFETFLPDLLRDFSDGPAASAP